VVGQEEKTCSRPPPSKVGLLKATHGRLVVVRDLMEPS
jgi:hypothetical protein